MVIRGLCLAAALVVAATGLGCGRGPYDDPCLVGFERLAVCGVSKQAPDEREVNSCRADPTTRCALECIAEASCDDLIEISNRECVRNDVTDCVSTCDPRPTDC